MSEKTRGFNYGELIGAYNLLHPVIKEAIREKGFIKPTEPQELAIPKILEGKNVLIIAPTGSGKTEAAVLPVLSMFRWGMDRGEYLDKGIYILYITPLRALNRDLLDRLMWWGERVGIKVGVRHGDTEQSDRARQSRDPPHMLITTPETLQAILAGKRLREHLKKVRWIIIDEVHELAEDKRGTQLALTLERIKWLIGRKPQIIGLSATVGSPEEVAKFLVGVDGECEIVQSSIIREMRLDVIHPIPTKEDEEAAKNAYLYPDAMARLRVIRELINKNGSTIIFVNTRSMAELLMYRFSMAGQDSVGIHHSSLSKTSRITTERAFKEGRLKAVIATSSLELGIDIGHVDFVIQYLSPHQVVRLVQRIGRSGHRLDKVPRGLVITEDLNDTLEAIAIVNRARAGLLERTQIPEKPYDVLVHQIVSLLMIKSRWSVDELYDIIRGAYPYRNLTLEELKGVLRFMSDILSPRLAYYIEEEGTVLKPSGVRARREMYRYFFDQMSMIPDEKHYLVINQTNEEPIGVLDEAFIAEYGEPGVKFVFRGGVWVLQKIVGDTVYVIPAKDVVGAIPSWVGEELPVPFEVAQDVGLIKAEAAGLIRKVGPEATVNILTTKLGVSSDTVKYVVDRVMEHMESGVPIPTDRVVLLERVGDLIVMHTHGGTLVNRTIARLLGDLLTERLGYPVGVQQDAYAIIIQLPRPGIDTSLVLQTIMDLASMDDKSLIDLAIRAIARTGIFKRKFVHVARRFNVIKKDRELSDVTISNLIELYKGSPVFTETLKEALTRDFDLDNAYLFLKSLLTGEREIKVVEGREFSPMSKEIVDKISHRLEIMAPEKIDKLVRESLKARLLNESSTLVCLKCGWVGMFRNKDIPDKPTCPVCGSTRLGRTGLDEERIKQVLSRVSEGRARAEDEEIMRRLNETAELVEKYGKLAILALSSRVRLDEIKEFIPRIHDLDKLVIIIHELERRELKRRFMED
ncbi:DEAD/DEAH box helicase [Vulcanisaeta thermophila]|uniref:DEAD/DEAH box helicase n=1 Tax=Vulcanisaeta thermophila TaxID=867917 RepID=UPI000853CA99|nr:DEAD/DEAH box helicase [Vulcanisaeta thermophila]